MYAIKPLLIIENRIRAKQQLLYMKKVANTLTSETPAANSLCEIWSVPPVVGDIHILILCSVTINKSSKGIVKINNIGFKNDV